MHRKDRGGVAVRAARARDVVRFGAERVGKQNVGVAGRRRHHVVADDDEFALRFVAQDGVRPVAVAVLVDEGVAARVDDHLDVVAELLDALQTVVDVVHFLAAHDRVRPEEARNRGLDGVLAHGKIDGREGDVPFVLTGVRAGETDVPREDREHRDGAGGFFAVRLTLRTPALRDEAGLRRADFMRETHDGLDGNAGDLRSPFRGLRRLVVAFAQDEALVVALLRSGRGQRLFVVAHAVLVKEGLIHPVVADELIGDRLHEGCVGARTDRDPFVGLADRRRCRSGR